MKDSNIKVGLKPLAFKLFAHSSKISKYLFTDTLFFESFLKTLGTLTLCTERGGVNPPILLYLYGLISIKEIICP